MQRHQGTKHTTVVEVSGELYGAYWWPIGAPWVKDVQERFVYVHGGFERTSYGHIRRIDEHDTLRDMLLAITADGDSSEGCVLSPDTQITVRQTRGMRERSRTFPGTMFASVADLVAREWAGWPEGVAREEA